MSKNINIPFIGFGTWKLTGEVCVKAVLKALEVGYRHIDTADRYGNHKEVAKAVKDSGIKREEIFITTKVWYTELNYRNVLDSLERFLDELQTDYIDLLLVHWPNRQIPIEETFDAFCELTNTKKIRYYGVSNYTIHHIEDVISKGYKPFVNQVELHPSFNQKELHEYCKSKNILLTAYSPLGMGDELKNPTVVELSKKYNVSPAQVILNWIISRRIAAIPKSTNPVNIKDNLKSLEWKMEEIDIEKINAIEQKPRLLNPPWHEFDY